MAKRLHLQLHLRNPSLVAVANDQTVRPLLGKWERQLILWLAFNVGRECCLLVEQLISILDTVTIIRLVSSVFFSLKLKVSRFSGLVLNS